MDELHLIERVNMLLNRHRDSLTPPTEGALAADLNVDRKTVGLWRRGLTIGKSARAFIRLTEDLHPCPHSIDQSA